MKKSLRVVSIIMSVIMVLCVSAFAHSGRTDSSGGHKDNKNKSGLGGYHYHCGGYPAHLHYDGVCPYSSSYSAPVYTPAPEKKVAPVVKPNYLTLSKVRTYINGSEMPTFTHSKNGSVCIIAEDLKDYGFDTDWNQNTKTLSIIKNINKPMMPLPMSYYNSFGIGYNFFKINDTNPITIIFKNNSTDAGYSPSSYSCDGYMAIPIDELKAFTEDWQWNSANMSMSFNIK